MESGISFNLNIFSFLTNNFLYELNLIELALFFISLYTLCYLIINKKTKYLMGRAFISFPPII